MSDQYIDYLLELLRPLGSVRAKRMFGGIGIYIDELFCAIVIDDSLYFKGDEQNIARYQAEACVPFTYDRDGVATIMHYYRVPDEALDSAHALAPWARLGMEAALRKSAQAASKANRAQTRTSNKSKAQVSSKSAKSLAVNPKEAIKSSKKPSPKKH